VTKALDILRDELDIAMALTGVTDAGRVPRDIILSSPRIDTTAPTQSRSIPVQQQLRSR
jgi:isopentenyl diphosphate isomerase/L-lactate dehydrogenase-like FMN-dependent dehydrogenase